MSSLALRQEFGVRQTCPPRPTTNTSACAPRGIVGLFLARIVAAFERSHERRVEREAGRFIAKHGARLTDDIERQLGEHLSGRGFPPYAPPRSFRPFARGG